MTVPKYIVVSVAKEKCTMGKRSLLWVKISLEFNHLDLINSNYTCCSKIDITHSFLYTL